MPIAPAAHLLRAPAAYAIAGLAAAWMLLWSQHAWFSPLPGLSALPFWHPARCRMELPLMLALLLACAWPAGASRTAWFTGVLAGVLPVSAAGCAIDLCCRSLDRPPGIGDLHLLPELCRADPWTALAAIALPIVSAAVLLAIFAAWCRARSWRACLCALLLRGVLALALAVAFASPPARGWWQERIEFHNWSDLQNARDFGRLSAAWAVSVRNTETRQRLAACPPPSDAPSFPRGAPRHPRNVYLLLLESLVDPRDFAAPLPAAVPGELVAALPPDGRFDRCLAPVFGGCSAQSEFELLTGAPALAAIGPIEYLAFDTRPCDGLVASAAEAGYRTIVAYGGESDYFNALRTHAALGFTERHYGNREPWGRPNPADRFITDADLLSNVLDRLRADADPRPHLVLIVGMEGHEQDVTHFPRDRERFPDVVHAPDPVEDELANLFYWRAKALADLLGRIARDDPEALVLILADHQPAALTGNRALPAGRYAVPALLLDGGRRVSIAGRSIHELPWLIWGLMNDAPREPLPDAEALRHRYAALIGNLVRE